MREKKTVCVGVVGAGAISDIYLTNMIGQFDNLRVKAVSARHLERARAKAEKYHIQACTVEELMADPEIEMVVNLTPVGAHEGIIRQALEAGKHVYTEKTLTDKYDTARALGRLADEKNLCLGCAPDTFLGSALQAARRAMDEGLLGEITGFSATANRDNDILLSLFAFLRQPGAGIMMDYAVYYLTALVSLLGPVSDTAAFVRAPFQRHQNMIPNSPEFGQWFDAPNESEVSAILRMKSGVTGTIHMNADSHLRDQANFVILGTKGMLYLTDPNGFGGKIRFLPNSHDFSSPLSFEDLADGNRYTENARGLGPSEMAEAILRGDRSFRTEKTMPLHVLEVLQAMLRSGEDGQIHHMTTTCEIPTAFYDGPLPES